MLCTNCPVGQLGVGSIIVQSSYPKTRRVHVGVLVREHDVILGGRLEHGLLLLLLLLLRLPYELSTEREHCLSGYLSSGPRKEINGQRVVARPCRAQSSVVLLGERPCVLHQQACAVDGDMSRLATSYRVGGWERNTLTDIDLDGLLGLHLDVEKKSWKSKVQGRVSASYAVQNQGSTIYHQTRTMAETQTCPAARGPCAARGAIA